MSQVLATVFFVLTNLWLSVWTGDDLDIDGINETNLYLGVYAGLGVASAIMLLILSIVLAFTTLNASLRMHQNMLQVSRVVKVLFQKNLVHSSSSLDIRNCCSVQVPLCACMNSVTVQFSSTSWSG